MKDAIFLRGAENVSSFRRAAGAMFLFAFLLGGCAEQTEKTEIKPPTDAGTMQQAQQALPANMPPEQRKKIEDSMRNSRTGATPAAPSSN